MAETCVAPCQVCESDANVATLLRLPEYAVARCRRCGFVYIDGDRDTIPPSAVDHFDTDTGYMRWLDIRNVVAEQVESVRTILDRAGTALEDVPADAPVLDVGCARGSYLQAFGRATGRTPLTGVDSAEAMVVSGREQTGLDLCVGDIERMALPTDHFGLITLWDVLEHLPHPRRSLAGILSRLVPGGWLVLEVPSEVTVFRTLARMGFRVSGGRLERPIRELYFPVHLSYFTPGSLRKLLTSLGGTRVTVMTKESHVTRFGLLRYPEPFRTLIRVVSTADKLLGTQAKILCAVQRPVRGSGEMSAPAEGVTDVRRTG
jgi:2-polyprenyl-3-methyl-5-hydroxy-6-metoxy-1,4-benzoquinol methylase